MFLNKFASTIFVFLTFAVSFLYFIMYLKISTRILQHYQTLYHSHNYNNHSYLKICSPINENFQQSYTYFDGVRYPKSLALSKNRSIDFKCILKNSPKKIILLWNKYYENQTKYFNTVLKKYCPITNCEYTSNKKLMNSSDLILLNLYYPFEMPRYRSKKQNWLFEIYESAIRFDHYFKRFDLKLLNNIFSLSSTYKLDSDILSSYELESNMIWEKNQSFTNNIDYLSNKKEFAAALISNCWSDKSIRLNLIKTLQRFINITIFGKCGIPCPNKTDCRKFIGDNYKFILSFENSFCKDYITEKFFKNLKYDIIQVVYGDGKYDHFVILIILSLFRLSQFSFKKDLIFCPKVT